jgi:ABC-type spermidine/putrescine transport system permease subunit I
MSSRGRVSPRERWGWIVSGLGLALMLAAVLYMTSSTVGGRVHEFRERRTYNQVKVAAQNAWPLTMVLGIAGLGLAMLGTRIRTAARKDARDE